MPDTYYCIPFTNSYELFNNRDKHTAMLWDQQVHKLNLVVVTHLGNESFAHYHMVRWCNHLISEW